MNVVRGSMHKHIYVSEDYFVINLVEDMIQHYEFALKYCNHSKKKEQIKKKIKMFKSILSK